jgi:hypothetical protein
VPVGAGDAIDRGGCDVGDAAGLVDHQRAAVDD